MIINPIAYDICNAKTIDESFVLYIQNWKNLLGWRFIFAAENGMIHGAVPGFAVNQDFSNGAAVRTIFSKDRVVVFDPDTLREMNVGLSVYPIDHSIGLDSNTLSYLKPYINNKGVPEDFVEVFEFISRDEVGIDPLPFLLENTQNLLNPKSVDKTSERYKYYEILRTLDREMLENHGVVISTESEEGLNKRIQKILGNHVVNYQHGNLEGMERKHRALYCILLGMASINLKTRKSHPSEKMKKFMDFLDIELGFFATREALLAYKYFERGQKLNFFGRIQKNKPNLLKNLKNMAWDMLHIRQMEENFKLDTEKGRYFFSAFLTFDKDLIEIIDLVSVKSMAIYQNESLYSFYETDPCKLIADGDADIENQIRLRFFSPEAKEKRAQVGNITRENMDLIICRLENELRKIAGITSPT